MMLTMPPFTVPTRPTKLARWSLPDIGLRLLALGLFGYLSGTWLCLLVIGYVLTVEGVFAYREWYWQFYAEQCEDTFVQVGQATQTLAGDLDKLTAAIEERDERWDRERVTIPLSGESSSTGPVRYWVSDSTGQN